MESFGGVVAADVQITGHIYTSSGPELGHYARLISGARFCGLDFPYVLYPSILISLRARSYFYVKHALLCVNGHAEINYILHYDNSMIIVQDRMG